MYNWFYYRPGSLSNLTHFFFASMTCCLFPVTEDPLCIDTSLFAMLHYTCRCNVFKILWPRKGAQRLSLLDEIAMHKPPWRSLLQRKCIFITQVPHGITLSCAIWEHNPDRDVKLPLKLYLTIQSKGWRHLDHIAWHNSNGGPRRSSSVVRDPLNQDGFEMILVSPLTSDDSEIQNRNF